MVSEYAWAARFESVASAALAGSLIGKSDVSAANTAEVEMSAYALAEFLAFCTELRPK
jgi:hypothetical protein